MEGTSMKKQLLGHPIDVLVLHNIRFGLLTSEIVKAFLPDANPLSGRFENWIHVELNLSVPNEKLELV